MYLSVFRLGADYRSVRPAPGAGRITIRISSTMILGHKESASFAELGCLRGDHVSPLHHQAFLHRKHHSIFWA